MEKKNFKHKTKYYPLETVIYNRKKLSNAYRN